MTSQEKEASWSLTYTSYWTCPSCGACICGSTYCMFSPAQKLRVQDLRDGSILINCPSCGGTHSRGEGTEVAFEKLRTQKRGYYVKGWASCASCGTVFQQITRQIPIEFDDLKCPNCGKSQLKIIPESVDRLENREFLFKVNIICKNKACGLSNLITSSFKGILKGIKRIVISLREGKMEIERY